MPQPKQHWFRSKWLLLVCVTVCVLVAVSFVKELLRSYRINQEIASLQSAIKDLEQHNKSTYDLVQYLKTETYVQEQARLKLGLKEEGEKVIVLQPTQGATSAGQGDRSFFLNEVLRDSQEPKSNPARWLVYFFGQS